MFVRTERTSGVEEQTTEEALLVAYCLRKEENGDSVAREGWTEMTESEER